MTGKFFLFCHVQIATGDFSTISLTAEGNFPSQRFKNCDLCQNVALSVEPDSENASSAPAYSLLVFFFDIAEHEHM